MIDLYGKAHKELQKEFDSVKIAEKLKELVVKKEFDKNAKDFIESRDMFFLSSIDHNDRPTVSYKGGNIGFVNVIDKKTLAFPSYEGNGMFMTLGNIKGNNKIGMLFIAFEKPQRLRVHGEAMICRNDPLISNYKNADLIIRVKLTDLWQNCPRYIHRYVKVSNSLF